MKSRRRHKVKKVRVKKIERKKHLFFPIFLIVLIIIVGGIFIYFNFFYNVTCHNESCFLSNLKVCEKSSYSSLEWQYKVLGIDKSNDQYVCKVRVRNLGLVNASADVVKKLRGKEMICYIPMKVAGTYLPYKDIEYCTGKLKEEILSIMLKKMYEYIIQHVGEFKLEGPFK